MKIFFVLLLVGLVLVSGCANLQDFNKEKPLPSETSDSGGKIDETSKIKSGFRCENDQSVKSRGYVLLMGLADHHKEVWTAEKGLMEKDPKAKFVLIYDQDENSKLEDISKKFLEDLNNTIKKNPVEELVIFGASAGGVTASYSIHKLDFSGTVALHTLSSPLKGYDFRGIGEAFLGERSVYEREIALGLDTFVPAGKNVKAYHHKTVTDTVLKDHYCRSFASLCDPIKIQNNNLAGSKEFYYPQYDHNPLMGPVIREVLKCYNPEIDKDIEKEEKDTEQNFTLGSLCAGEENCKIFCHASKGACTQYCDKNPDNMLCQNSWAYDCVYSSELPFCQKVKADLEDAYNSLDKKIEGAIRNGPKYTKEGLDKIYKEIDDLRLSGYNRDKISKLQEKARSNLYVPPTPTPTPPEPPKPKYPENFFNPDIPCTINPDVRFTNIVVNPENLDLIVPLGSITHPEATTHTYLFVGNRTPSIYVPADSVLTGVDYSGKDYGFTFQASCEFIYTFGHITDPIESIKKFFETEKVEQRGTEKLVSPLIKFKAGDLLGKTGGTEQAHGFDLGAYHKNQANYYVNNERYRKGSFKFYNAVCPYDYFESQTKAAYYSKFGGFGGVVPGATCGTAGQDKAGTISGNWHDTSNIEWDTSSKKIVFGTDGEAADAAVRIMMTSRPVFFIFWDSPTYKKPKEVTGEHCYEDTKSDTIIYVKIISDMEMKLVVDDTAKTCPDRFPEEKAVGYYR